MILIGEKINGFIPKTLSAIHDGDGAYIKRIALAQAKGGADYLDICAGTSPDDERETMRWLIQIVQSTVDTPVCIDSSDPQVLVDMMGIADEPGMVNSVSMEEGRCEAVFPALSEADPAWTVIALTCDANGIPDEPEGKRDIAARIIGKAGEYGIAHDRIFIDPIVSSLTTKRDSLRNLTDTISLIKADYPDVHFTSGLGNISFGLPMRKAVDMQFLALAMASGLDSAILDPTSPDIQVALHATEALLGIDPDCAGYLQAYRDGLFGARR